MNGPATDAEYVANLVNVTDSAVYYIGVLYPHNDIFLAHIMTG